MLQKNKEYHHVLVLVTKQKVWLSSWIYGTLKGKALHEGEVWGVDVQIHASLTSTLVGYEWPASFPSSFSPREKPRVLIGLKGRWVPEPVHICTLHITGLF
jgi:hypothetical protein